MCGRKHKFGLNCQAVCDIRGRFLDISITCGGASSDVVAFESSYLKRPLDFGLLALNLVLFGDNACINSRYMATLYPNTSGGPKENYNFFHSQLRIRIECAFGVLVQRWGILRIDRDRSSYPCTVVRCPSPKTASAEKSGLSPSEYGQVHVLPQLQNDSLLSPGLQSWLQPNCHCQAC